jgi:uncharacterized MAPEG superfamily protein
LATAGGIFETQLKPGANNGVSPMVLVVLLVLALFVLQTLLPTRFREAPAPGGPTVLEEAFGNRDHQRPHTVVGQRGLRALANMQEALPVFIALALLNLVVAPGGSLAVTGAWVFLIARVLYLAIYLAGVAVVRTLLWLTGLVGLAMMVVPLVGH